MKYSQIIKENSSLAANVSKIEPFKIRVLSNFTASQLGPVLSRALRCRNINPEITFGEYDNIVQESFEIEALDLVIVAYDLLPMIEKIDLFSEDISDTALEDLYLSATADIKLVARNLSSVPTVIFNSFSRAAFYSNSLCGSKIDSLCDRLNKYIQGHDLKNIQLIDIDKLVMHIGVNEAFDYRMYLHSKTLFTVEFWVAYVSRISAFLAEINGRGKKVLALDCDNTLWGGIIGEDGLDGIKLARDCNTGKIFREVQQIFRWLSNNGVLIVIVSKNNMADVDEVFSRHPDMILTCDDVVAKRVNWQDKSTNLREIAADLNLGLDSFFFVDDSDFEINLIKEQIPEVTSFQVPKTVEEYPKLLLSALKESFFLRGSEADQARRIQYKQQSDRAKERSGYQTLEDYLESIGIIVDISVNNADHIDRVAQLTQKTNQFNLTTKRLTVADIEKLIRSEHNDVFIGNVSDKFGDSGLTVVVLSSRQDEHVMIDNFIMSCRVMGRRIEYAVLDHLVEYYRAQGYLSIGATYLPTAKNLPVKDFYLTAGLREVASEHDGSEYQIETQTFVPSDASFITMRHHG